MNDSRLVIVGFMGCGKTEVARELAKELGSDWIDLDAVIEKHERRSPAEIITTDGEVVFREREIDYLEKLLTSGDERVIALGGGAWTTRRVREVVQEHNAVTVWLDAPFELCWKRIEADARARPLAPTREIAQELYSDRLAIYSLADLHVSVDNKSPIAIAQDIAALLR